MLDFYIIKEEQITPNSPTGLEFIGQLDDNTFRNLKTKGIIDKSYDYYSDFRWNSKTILQIRQNSTKSSIQEDTDIKLLNQLLDLAENRKSGIIAFTD
ncbi:hypothetical protein [Flavobacterium sp. CSZ]|uniref:hypothetical protein n=1 Tax=Flavobacterium sp. CSZ TaxID=2783791 RepID=UPI00188D203D|nr:hypothetical protein [Flavobacterium sp. CSZ]MBF4487356.1 hypothetical protein [Flavobacterium sp. CSZ]